MTKIPFRTLKGLKDIRGKRVLIRLDLNLPIQNGIVQNDFRVRRSLPTIQFFKKAGAKIILIAYGSKSTDSLKPIAQYLNKTIQVGFIPAVIGKLVTDAVSKLPNGGILLLENTRSVKGEEKNSLSLAKELAALGDIYINEAFSNSHRAYASIVRLPKLLPSYAGFLFEDEYINLLKARKPKKPFCFILGGAKFETKLPLIKHFLPMANKIFILGGPANAFFKMKGYEMGKSISGSFFKGLKPLLNNKKILLPRDVLLLSGRITSPKGLLKDDKIVDIGPLTLLDLKECVYKSKSILFNGPVGIYDDGFDLGTEGLLKVMAKSKAETVVGGGDTLALVTRLKLENKFTFASTGGGAMLQFLAEGTLPGIEALSKNK